MSEITANGRWSRAIHVTLSGVALLAAGWLISSGASGQAPDRQASAAITKADRDFSQAVADRDRARFLGFIAENATFNGGTANELHGREAVSAAWADFFDKDGPTLTWVPTQALVTAAGDVGSTTGTAVQRTKGRDGPVQETRSAYVTVWRRQPDGSWKAIFDAGSALP